MKLEGKSAIVTGGGGKGIGAATAMLFAKHGARVLINGRTEDRLVQVVEEAKKEGLEIKYIVADVANEEDCKNTVDMAIREFGQVDVLFNNAGILVSGIAHEADTEMFKKILDVNVVGTFLMSKYAIIDMLKRKKGCIVNNSSAAGIKGFPYLPAYSASKGAVNQLTKNMAIDYADKGIRINAVCPGGVWTPMMERFMDKAEDRVEAENYMKSFYPMDRLASDSEIANAALFLCDDKIEFITGTMLSVDGGFIAK
ncbi:MAG: SDR family NAD(P)-dependent oxidoreductase [Thermodesulfobacteriota bacterium]